MIAWIGGRAKERSTWMSLFSLVGAVSLAFTLEHKELIITAAIAVVAVIAALTRDNPAAECLAAYFLSWGQR